MNKNSIWKWLILLVLVMGSFAVVYPPSLKIPLGLDIKGGTSFTVELDQVAITNQLRADNESITDVELENKMPAIRKEALDRAQEVLRNRIDGLGIAEPIIYAEKGGRIVIQLPGVGKDKSDEAERQIQSVAFLTFRLVHEKNSEMVDSLFEKNLVPPGYTIVESSEKGPEKQFYKRNTNAVPVEKVDAEFKETVKRFHAPPGYELLLRRHKSNEQDLFVPVFVSIRKELTGDALKTAMVNVNPMNGKNEVDLTFKSSGAKKFAAVTRDCAPGGSRCSSATVGRQLGIILDDTLYSDPVIREPIPSGQAQISGDFTTEEAHRLANVLKAGSLPAPVKIVERRKVDPSLGADAVHSGIWSGIYGCIAIIVMMALYYRVNGLLADFALVLNVVLLPLGAVLVAGFLGMIFGGLQGGAKVGLPVLTLPGIAGITLAIGMAVDANVLIFERMREELRAGKGFQAAVDAGFDRAFTAIFDSNMTTIITAVIMFAAGSGPVRGYAITLTAGLIINLYTAVTVTKMCYDYLGSRHSTTAVLKMFSIIGDTTIDFISKWKIALGISWLIIGVSWAIMISNTIKHPETVFAVDFRGGTALTMGYSEKNSVEDLRKALSGGGVRDAMIQYQTSMGVTGAKDVLLVRVGTIDEGKLVESVLKAQFPKSEFKVLQQDDVGPQVGKELKVKAAWALGLALLAMIIYIAFRFEFGFGLGAIVATVHDVLMTIGICHLCGFQMNMTIMAAVLTIIGYSVNDTIVIFDRIRENLRLVRNKSFVEICNLSVNQTLSRTLLTYAYTMISVIFLLALGGGAIKDFSFAMLIGMITGCYSTIYIATPIVLLWHKFERPDLGKS